MSKTVLKLFLVAGAPFIAAVTGGCIGEDKSDYHGKVVMQSGNAEAKKFIDEKELAMRHEIIEYAKYVDANSGGDRPVGQIDIYNIVEKYIKIGDSYEKAKSILVGNGFSVYEYSVEDARNRKDIKISYRVGAGYKMDQSVFHRRDIAIFLGKGPESKEVDSIVAKINFKAV